MKTRLSSFLEELRNSDEGRRRRWAAGLSAAAMLLVVSFWLATLDVNINSLREAGEAEESWTGTFLNIMKTGGAIVWQNIVSLIGKEREVEILREEFTFVPKDGPAAPQNTLPIGPARQNP